MGFWANAAARTELKTRDAVLGLLREHRPDFKLGNVLLPCHIISEAHNGFYVDTGTNTVAIFRCQLHWWGREIEAETLEGLRSPNPAAWMKLIGSVPPVDMGSMRGGAPEFAAGLAFGLQ